MVIAIKVFNIPFFQTNNCIIFSFFQTNNGVIFSFFQTNNGVEISFFQTNASQNLPKIPLLVLQYNYDEESFISDYNHKYE
jgi:hypothetical protein